MVGLLRTQSVLKRLNPKLSVRMTLGQWLLGSEFRPTTREAPSRLKAALISSFSSPKFLRPAWTEGMTPGLGGPDVTGSQTGLQRPSGIPVRLAVSLQTVTHSFLFLILSTSGTGRSFLCICGHCGNPAMQNKLQAIANARSGLVSPVFTA